MLNHRVDPTSGNIFKKLSLLALPMIIGNILQNLFQVVDMIFVGKLGPEAIAAVSFVGILANLIWTILIGLAISANAMISRFIGAGDDRSAHIVSVQGIFLGIFFSGLLFIFGLYGAEYSLKLLGAEEQIIKTAIPYFKIIFCGSFTLIFMFLPAAYMRGSGDSFKPMIFLGVATIINIILDPLLIFGIGFFPRLEVTGAAIATIIGQGIGASIGIGILFSGKTRIKIGLHDFTVNFDIIKRLIKIAIPGSGQGAMRSIAALVFIRIVSDYGVYAVAAYGIGMRLFLIALMPGFAVAAAASIMVGQNLGAQKPARSERAGWIAVFSYAGLLFIPAVLSFIFAPYMIKVFNTNPNVVIIGAKYLKIVVISFPFIAAALVFASSLNGAGDTVSPMIIIGMTVVVIQLVLALYLPDIMSVKTDGLWWAGTIAIILQGIFMALRFHQGKWKEKTI